MSQTEILNILKDLGGCARGDISKRAKEKYPQYSLYKYVGNRLTRLKVRGEISYNPLTREWFIPNYIIAD